jgi:hypothetical protein
VLTSANRIAAARQLSLNFDSALDFIFILLFSRAILSRLDRSGYS